MREFHLVLYTVPYTVLVLVHILRTSTSTSTGSGTGTILPAVWVGIDVYIRLGGLEGVWVRINRFIAIPKVVRVWHFTVIAKPPP